jgi:outer membrane protein TolC
MKHRVGLKNLLSILILMIGLGSVKAQEVRRLSLPEAISLSIKNSKQLKGSEARIEQATAELKQAVQSRLPDAKVSGAYMRVNNPIVDFKIKSSNSGGGGNTNDGNSTKVSQAAYGMANVSLPLFTGGKIRYGIESSRFLEQATRLDAENDREAVILNTIDAYNNLFKAKAAVTIVDSSLAEARERVKQYTRLEQNGVLARNDLLKAQLQESNTELSLLDAQNNARLANINMNLMLGLPDNTELLADTASFNSLNDSRTIADYLQLAYQNRKDLSALDLRKKAAETAVKSTRADLLPNLALTGGYVALDVPHALTVYNAVNIGLGVQYNIASLWKNGKIDQAKARVKEVEANKEALNDAIKLQINQAYQNYLSSQKKIDVYHTAIAQAEENYKVNLNKFNNGLATVTDVLDADVARLQARLNFAFAKTDTYVAYSRLLHTAGLLNESQNPAK